MFFNGRSAQRERFLASDADVRTEYCTTFQVFIGSAVSTSVTVRSIRGTPRQRTIQCQHRSAVHTISVINGARIL